MTATIELLPGRSRFRARVGGGWGLGRGGESLSLFGLNSRRGICDFSQALTSAQHNDSWGVKREKKISRIKFAIRTAAKRRIVLSFTFLRSAGRYGRVILGSRERRRCFANFASMIYTIVTGGEASTSKRSKIGKFRPLSDSRRSNFATRDELL